MQHQRLRDVVTGTVVCVERAQTANAPVEARQRGRAGQPCYGQHMADHRQLVAAGPAATMHTGPLGSTIHVLHADAGTVAAGRFSDPSFTE